MVVPLRLLRPASYGRQPAVAGFFLLLLELSPLAPTCCLDHLYRWLRWSIGFVPAEKKTRIAIRQLGAGGNGARDGADSSPYTREHATEFALDARFARRPGELWLGSLHGLRQRRDAALAVDLLDTKQISLVAVGGAYLLDASVPRWLVHRGSQAAVSSRRRGYGGLLARPRRVLLRMGSIHVHHTNPLPIRRLVRLRVCGSWRREAVLVVGVRRRMVPIGRSRGIGMRSAVMRSRGGGRVFVVSRGLHGSRIVWSSCRFETGPCPVPRVRRAAVLLLLWSLLHLTRILLLVHPVCPGRLDASQSHIPALPLPVFSLAKFHLALLAFTFLSLSLRNVPLVLILHHPDGTLRVVFLRWPELFPVPVHLGWRSAGLDRPRRPGVRIRPWRAHRSRRHAAGRHPS